MTKKPAKKPKILLCEDDRFARDHIAELLFDSGYEVISATSESKVYELINTEGESIDVAIVDIRLPKTEQADDADTEHGKRAGVRVARYLREHFPDIRVIGASFFSDSETRFWFSEYCFAYIHKTWLLDRADAREYGLRVVDQAAKKRYKRLPPSSFIVHGHDTKALSDLKDFVTNELKWQEPKILQDLYSGGRTIIEKFEEATKGVDAVFVLLTPDDEAAPVSAPDEVKRRARQNVIFEMGYFFGKMQRTGGRVLLLHHGDVELPSDLHGIVYIDISGGIASAGKAIKREVQSILPSRE